MCCSYRGAQVVVARTKLQSAGVTPFVRDYGVLSVELDSQQMVAMGCFISIIMDQSALGPY